MDLPDYLRFVAGKLETADRAESMRLVRLLRDVLIETLEKYDQPAASPAPEASSSHD